MTESYLINKKLSMNQNTLTSERRELTLKESTVKEDSVDSISINSNTEPNKYNNDDCTHYTETNSIDRMKTKKNDINLAFKHKKKKEVMLKKDSQQLDLKNIINLRTSEKELKNQIYHLENELVNTQHAYNTKHPKENYNSLINNMNYCHSTSFNKNLRSFRGRLTEKKAQNKSNERQMNFNNIDMTPKINDTFGYKNPHDFTLKKTNSLYHDKGRVNMPVKIPHDSTTLKISNEANKNNVEKNLKFEKWETSISPKPTKGSFNKNKKSKPSINEITPDRVILNKEAKTPTNPLKTNNQTTIPSLYEAKSKEFTDNTKPLSEANNKTIKSDSRKDSLKIYSNNTNSQRNIDTTVFNLDKEIKKNIIDHLKIEIDSDIKTSSQQDIPSSGYNIVCDRPKTPPVNVQNFIVDIKVEKPVSDLGGFLRPKSYSNNVYNLENLDTEANVVKSQTNGSKKTKENNPGSPFNFAESQTYSNVDKNYQTSQDETKSETVENKVNSVQRPSTAQDKSRNNQNQSDTNNSKTPHTPTNKICAGFFINASPWHSPERTTNANLSQSDYYSQKKSAKKIDCFNNDINLNLDISNYNKNYKKIDKEKKVYNNYNKSNYYNEFPHMSHSNYNTNHTNNYTNHLINQNHIITMTLPSNPKNYYNYRYQNIPNKIFNVPDRTQIDLIDAKEVANEFFMNHLQRNINNLCFNLNEHSKSLESSRTAIYERLKKVIFFLNNFR